MAKLELPKLTSRVRFPSPAPIRPETIMVSGFFVEISTLTEIRNIRE